MITLIGHGYIGTAIARELDAQKQVYRWLTHGTFRPGGSCIINAAGYTGSPNVDACEENKAECIEGNILWPSYFHRIAFSSGLPTVHISSGCVYTGYEKAWTEKDEPNFDFTNGSFYSGCKAMFEKMFRATNVKSYLLRVRMPFGPEPHPKNLLTKLKGYPKLINQLQSISNVQDVAKAAVTMALHLPPPGVYNCVNPGAVTTAEIAELMGWGKEYFTPADFRAVTKAPRSECELSTAKMSEVYKMRTAKEALADCVETMT